MELYSKEEVQKFINGAMQATMFGMLEFFEKETDCVNETTGEVIEDCELKLKPNAQKPSIYIADRMKEHGINMDKCFEDIPLTREQFMDKNDI